MKPSFPPNVKSAQGRAAGEPAAPPPEDTGTKAGLFDALPLARPPDGNGIRGVLIFALVAAVLLLLAALTPLRHAFSPETIQHAVRKLGIWGPAIIVVAGILSPLVFLPRWPIAYVAGMLYGVPRGVLLSTVASTLGAWLHFILAANLLGPAANRMRDRMKLKPVRAMPPKRVFMALFLIRAFPVSNFVATNLLAGAMHVRTGIYLSATFLGMIPSSILYAMGGRMTLEPSLSNVLILAVLIAAILLGAWIGRRHWLPHTAE